MSDSGRRREGRLGRGGERSGASHVAGGDVGQVGESSEQPVDALAAALEGDALRNIP
jgi:hypothetical protein